MGRARLVDGAVIPDSPSGPRLAPPAVPEALTRRLPRTQWMRLARYAHGGNPSWGVVDGTRVYPLGHLPGGEPTLEELTNPRYVEQLEDVPGSPPEDWFDLDAVSLLAPVPVPGKIICIGMNYRDHAEEQDAEIPEAPLLFGKAPTSVTNPGSPIVHPEGEEVDYEVELGVVIGRHARRVSVAEAADYIAGYTVINDVSGRQAQFADGQWFRGKSYDTFSPMGPTIRVGSDYDPNGVDVELRVDGEVKQSSNTEEFIFDVYEVVSYISDHMTLRPGDVISTGTPGGVGIFRDPVDLLEPGQVCEAEIEGIGVLENPVVASRG